MILREIFRIQYTMPQKYLTIIRTYYDKLLFRQKYFIVHTKNAVPNI